MNKSPEKNPLTPSEPAGWRILHVVDCLEIGGAETVVVQSANLFSEKGHQVSVATILRAGPLSLQLKKSVYRLVLCRKRKWNLFKLWQLRQWITHYDIVHVHMRHVLKYVILAKVLFPFKQKIVFHDHYGKIRIDKRLSPSLRLCLPFVDYVGVSRELCHWALHTAGLKKEKVHYLPNTTFRFANAGPLRIEKTSRKLVMIANFRPEKNIEFALRLIHACLPEQRFVLDVFGQAVDKPYIKKLNALIHKLNLNRQVFFFHGQSDIDLSCHKYDLGLHTARSETGPLVLIEYMAVGLPFLAFNTGEAASQVKVQLPQLIMDNFNLECWKSRLSGFDLSGRREAALTLRKISETQYSPEKYYNRLTAIYQAIV
jgi:glycosyltransferase involved in cell wall biosynthesis